jgi:hypothetical protein
MSTGPLPTPYEVKKARRIVAFDSRQKKLARRRARRAYRQDGRDARLNAWEVY